MSLLLAAKKGKIESPFKYIENQFIKGNDFANMEELNRRLKKNIDEWCNETHTTTRRIPNQHYLLEEKALLLPLPKGRYRTKKMQSRKISPDSFVNINSNKYSVPVKYVGKTVLFRINYGFRIELYDAKENYIMSFEQTDKNIRRYPIQSIMKQLLPKSAHQFHRYAVISHRDTVMEQDIWRRPVENLISQRTMPEKSWNCRNCTVWM